jgi:hypothetical protein
MRGISDYLLVGRVSTGRERDYQGLPGVGLVASWLFSFGVVKGKKLVSQREVTPPPPLKEW